MKTLGVKAGDRVELLEFHFDPENDSWDDNLDMPSGTMGTVTGVFDALADHGQIHVDWDNGRVLNLLERDRYRVHTFIIEEYPY